MQLHNAWRGTSREIEATNLANFKERISEEESIEPSNLLLSIAPQGHQLRDANMSGAHRIFLYDKSWVLPPSKGNQLPHIETIDSSAGPEKSLQRLVVAEMSSENKPEIQTQDKSEKEAQDENQAESSVSHSKVDDNANIAIVYEGIQLIYRHMSTNLEAVARQLKKLKHAKSQLEDDVKACANWRKYYDAMQQIPVLSNALGDLLDVAEVEESYSTLNSVWSNLKRALLELTNVLESSNDEARQFLKEPLEQQQITGFSQENVEGIQNAQDRLASTSQTAGHFQSEIMTKLRKPLSILHDDLKHAENLKFKVAKVVDLPFLYGVLSIESSRRSKWDSDFGPIFRREFDRRLGWHKFYCQGSLGPLVKRLDEIGKFGMATDVNDMSKLESFGKSCDDSIDSDKRHMVGFSEVAEYLNTLNALHLDDMSKDLQGELGAMKRQFAKSMSSSISSLIPQLVNKSMQKTGSLSPFSSESPPRPSSVSSTADNRNGASQMADKDQNGMEHTSNSDQTIAAYEARLRKLETLLMQARLGSKSHELDIIRAETRAEARAEARAEVHAEQQQTKIDELELRNRELSSRLSRYTDGLETVLNSMGSQTSRVDPDTGNPIYKVNRVKGLSRRVSPPLPESRGSADSMSNGANSNHEAETSSSSLNDSARTNVSIERFLDQTFVDNHVSFEAVNKRFGDVEKLARKLQMENRRMREGQVRYERELRQRVALHSFRPEDLILFLPTRDPRRQPNPWAAFNAAAPHYFLHPKHAEQSKNREYLIARASAIEKHIVESTSDAADNPFDLPVGVEWYLISIHGEWGV